MGPTRAMLMNEFATPYSINKDGIITTMRRAEDIGNFPKVIRLKPLYAGWVSEPSTVSQAFFEERLDVNQPLPILARHAHRQAQQHQQQHQQQQQQQQHSNSSSSSSSTSSHQQQHQHQHQAWAWHQHQHQGRARHPLLKQGQQSCSTTSSTNCRRRHSPKVLADAARYWDGLLLDYSTGYWQGQGRAGVGMVLVLVLLLVLL